jgi:hypothetical protein
MKPFWALKLSWGYKFNYHKVAGTYIKYTLPQVKFTPYTMPYNPSTWIQWCKAFKLQCITLKEHLVMILMTLYLGIGLLHIRNWCSANFTDPCWTFCRWKGTGERLGHSVLRIVVTANSASGCDCKHCCLFRMQFRIFLLRWNHRKHDLRCCKWWRKGRLPRWLWWSSGFWRNSGWSCILGSWLRWTQLPRSVF